MIQKTIMARASASSPLKRADHRTMDSERQTESEWEPCPSGTITRYARRQVRRTASRVVAVASVLLATGLLFLPSDEFPDEHRFGGIGCSDVHKNCGKFQAGELEKDLTDEIHRHLVECPSCKAQISELPPPKESSEVIEGQPIEMLKVARLH
ncbi:MAG: hypothetical protein CMJ78_00205 [Planctomycetaceae bacterium]|nr:hypothetical protein [Planctomycetaceae bacterium]